MRLLYASHCVTYRCRHAADMEWLLVLESRKWVAE